MELNDNGLEDGWSILDKWFGSDAWTVICHDASEDCKDSMELMEEISDNLASLIFHLNNDTGSNRVSYELGKFQELISDFEV